MQVRKIIHGLAVVALYFMPGGQGSMALAGCPCTTDVDNVDGMQFVDIAVVRDCINGDCSQCVNSCDVDCDGDVDYYDAGVVACAFQGASNCCAEPDGACTDGGGATPPCVVTTDDYCTVFSGTWHGDLTSCRGGVAIPIPAASTWGLTALAMSTVISATLILRRRAAA